MDNLTKIICALVMALQETVNDEKRRFVQRELADLLVIYKRKLEQED